ncbi:capsular polysaccharide transport system permease protein [Sulfitobacter marinus]|uniref:Capsular polysaccharide transport system permease protein n=1 Tax=Sulfitobacter marinus TaxID=394264 RepID=A0A1I6T9P2_9RHOB|nr:capsule biosynthesis protein [Sulfitobacter marinus]SFS85924.1 capsular polysaccharide transport system permease protein [Sulfitobacter marinus]
MARTHPLQSQAAERAENLPHDVRKALKIRERKEALARVEEQRDIKKAALAARGQLNVEKANQNLPAVPQTPDVVAPPVRPARIKPRHRFIFLSFVICVLGTNLIAAWYLWERAADRFVSVAGFSVRAEDSSSAIELLGGMAELPGSGSPDEDILYEFIQSQDLVRTVDNALDLRRLWSKADPDIDPVFSYHPPGSIEDLTDYWLRMVSVYNDSSTGLIELEVQAFTPQDAQDIARFIYDESSRMINRLSDIAREDATRLAREELETAVQRLKIARSDMTKFRNLHQVVTPESTLSIQTGLLSSLEMQLAETLISLDMLGQISSPKDPRVKQAIRRQGVIEQRLKQERAKLGIGSEDGSVDNPLVDLVGEFESLMVDREFAEQSYAAALIAYDVAVSESRRQSRYLAAHIQPTLAETSIYPDRLLTIALVALFSLLIWAIMVMVGYSLRDRR